MLFETKQLLPLTAVAALALSGCSMGPKEVVPPPMDPPKFVIEGVNFDFDQSSLKPQATQTLDYVAGELSKQADVPYEVGGHTDSKGSDAYNQDLSEARALTVRDYLVGQGVSSSQLTPRGYGESMPIATNDTEAGRAQNRRVEIKPIQ